MSMRAISSSSGHVNDFDVVMSTTLATLDAADVRGARRGTSVRVDRGGGPDAAGLLHFAFPSFSSLTKILHENIDQQEIDRAIKCALK